MITPIILDNKTIGSVEENPYYRYCLLTDLHATDVSKPAAVQARETFERMEAVLVATGMNFRNVVRTWLFADHILDWYGELNAVRDTFFRERGVFGGVVPASTGVGMPNALGAALTADVLAVQPRAGEVKILPVPSPLQCAALDYGSSFSRAVEVDAADAGPTGQRRLYISGTASISPDGKTAHVGDVRGQIDLTMRVIQAILELRSMSWRNTTRAVAYVKRVADFGKFQEYLAKHRLEFLPVKTVQADICREDLLFEVELDATM